MVDKSVSGHHYSGRKRQEVKTIKLLRRRRFILEKFVYYFYAYYPQTISSDLSHNESSSSYDVCGGLLGAIYAIGS